MSQNLLIYFLQCCKEIPSPEERLRDLKAATKDVWWKGKPNCVLPIMCQVRKVQCLGKANS